MNAKEKMIDALFKLLSIKKYNDISVSELCLVSKVHRTTFYLYYDNMYELLEDSTKEAFKRLDSYFSAKDKEEYHLTEKYLLPYMTFVKDYPNLFLAYLTNAKVLKSNEILDHMFKDVIYPRRQCFSEEEIKYITLFYLGGITTIIVEWIQSGLKKTPQEITDLLVKAINGFKNN